VNTGEERRSDPYAAHYCDWFGSGSPNPQPRGMWLQSWRPRLIGRIDRRRRLSGHRGNRRRQPVGGCCDRRRCRCPRRRVDQWQRHQPGTPYLALRGLPQQPSRPRCKPCTAKPSVHEAFLWSRPDGRRVAQPSGLMWACHVTSCRSGKIIPVSSSWAIICGSEKSITVGRRARR
jgi:hypothetical protein